ncbi:carboxymuconolactone decarboxylase family protein [Lentzea sp.]|uniref:carboxymuconolactone decarboxylase family protein n=1 Tax=Lentzea sp. TaxID=56099 RepID=UPI002C8F02D4|nr:carboxymuconolactone decarboxylase family protein [Lentzea sp.]HUQ59162.1 carboxymuconolactone decarboxylase family protein [Lentzea sp.]
MTGPSYTALSALAKTVDDNAVLPAGLRELVKLRCSQLNGCKFCIRLHSAQSGETEERLENLASWRTHPDFTGRERAAFALAEAVTLVHDGQVPQPVLDDARREFGEEGVTDLLWTAIVVNAFNRLAISTRLG